MEHGYERSRACAAVLVAPCIAGEATQAWRATQVEARGKALAWMVQQQNGDGSWVDVARMGPVIPTAVFVDSLSSSGIRHGYVSGAATSWLLNNEPDTVEGLARQITALARTSIVSSGQTTQLNLNNGQVCGPASRAGIPCQSGVS